MKSIKEKVDEIFPIEECDSWEIELKRLKMRQCYEHGANYVLERIEDILTNPRRYVNPDKSVEEGMVDAIIKCVEQLKRNQ